MPYIVGGHEYALNTLCHTQPFLKTLMEIVDYDTSALVPGNFQIEAVRWDLATITVKHQTHPTELL